MKKKWGSYQDSSSDEEVPLALQSNGLKSAKREAKLLQRSIEKCEFCEEVFFNKYNILVHNAKHIIIPLLKQTYHQCPECLHHFESIESLEWHTINKHPDITRNNVPELLRSFVKKEPIISVKTPVDINNMISRKESLLESFVKQEPITVLTKEDFGIDIKRDVIYDISDDDVTDTKSDIDAGKFDTGNDFDDVDNYDDKSNFFNGNVELNNSKRIKDRLMFEEEPNGLIVDLTTDCKVNLEMFDDKWINSLQNDTMANGDINEYYEDVGPLWRRNAIILGNKPTSENASVPKSVHYDELIRPESCKCKICYKAFPNRYDLIVHETTHMDYKKRKMPCLCRLCDWYISTGPKGLSQHILNKHHGRVFRKVETQQCGECGLSYARLHRHLSNYHYRNLCSFPRCEEYFESLPDLEEHKRTCHGVREEDDLWNTKLEHVCELCYSFFRNKTNLNYEYYGEISEVGKTQQCERCQKSFFSVNIVRLRSKKHAKHNTETALQKKKKRQYSNTDRLKNVRMRLKQLKSLNKF